MLEKLKKLFKNKDEIRADLHWLGELSYDVRFYVVVFFLISMFSMLISLVSPVASKYVVDAAISPDQAFRPEYAAIMFASTLVTVVLESFSNIFSNYVNEKYAFNVRARMYDRTQRGKWSDVAQFHSGDMLARLTDDVNTVASNIISILPNLIITVLKLAIILVILLKTDPALALIGLIIGPVGMVLALFFRKPFRKYQTILRKSQSEYYTFFQESLGNLDVIKVFELEDKNNEYFADIRSRRLKTVIKSAKMQTMMSSAMKLVYGLGYVIAFCWCAKQLGSSESYTYGTMTLFLTLVTQLQMSLRGLGDVIPSFYSTLIATKRIREISEKQPEVKAGLTDMPSKVGLSVKDLTFAYDKKVILDDISVEIAPCERVAVVGPSGMGKTTFIRILLALLDPGAGTVEYVKDNGEREAVNPDSRRFISYVPQGNTLLTGTVRDNLLIGDPDATEEQLWKALEAADAARFLRSDPKGLDLPIKENSGGLSTGQAQRICIARALLRKRPVMILDEATSALDEATERRVFETLSEDEEHTFFIITHRRSMLKYCTSVLELTEDGKINYTRL